MSEEILSSKVLQLPGLIFSIILLSNILLPAVGFITAEFGFIISAIFSISILLLFPFEALLELKFKRPVSISKNITVVFLISLIFFFLSGFWPGNLFNKLVVFMLAFSFFLLISIVYNIFVIIMPKFENFIEKLTNRDIIHVDKERKWYSLIYIVIPTVFVVLLIFGILMNFGIDLSTIQTMGAEKGIIPG